MPATYSVVPTVATGDWITSGWVNTYIGTNMAANWPGTAAGDLEYYISSVEKARLAKPSLLSYLQNTTAGVPAWSRDIRSMIGALHTLAIVESTTEFITTSLTGADITGMTVNLVTTENCNLMLIASGSIAATGGSDQAILIPSIAGVNHALDASLPRTYFTQYTSVAVAWGRFGGIAAGTHTFKLRLASAGGANAYFLGGTLIAMAFVKT